jgi:hypothetical protein
MLWFIHWRSQLVQEPDVTIPRTYVVKCFEFIVEKKKFTFWACDLFASFPSTLSDSSSPQWFESHTEPKISAVNFILKHLYKFPHIRHADISRMFSCVIPTRVKAPLYYSNVIPTRVKAPLYYSNVILTRVKAPLYYSNALRLLSAMLTLHKSINLKFKRFNGQLILTT